MKTLEEQQKLSKSLLSACKAAGIENPKYIMQGSSRAVYHSEHDPRMYNGRYDFTQGVYINHPPYASDWQDSLLEWVEPQGEPLADVLARHPDHVADGSKMTDRYTVELHGKGYAVYLDRTSQTRGLNLAHLSECTTTFADRIQASLNGKYPPQANHPSGIEAMVCDDIAKRQQVGIAKYGVTVAENPLTHAQWLQHAYEECLDMSVYLKRAMEERRSK